MIKSGLLCTINTDDPEMFSTNLNEEYKRLFSQGFSLEELYELNKNAIESSFLMTEKKMKLHQVLDNYRNKRGSLSN